MALPSSRRCKQFRGSACNNSWQGATLVAALNWLAQNRVRPAVANLSLGGNGTNSMVHSAVRALIDSGVVTVIASSQEATTGLNACNFSPSRVTQALIVGWTNSLRRRRNNFNFDTCLDLFAPGHNVTTIDLSGQFIVSGTSAAAAHASGVAALALESDP
jgi:serine protease